MVSPDAFNFKVGLINPRPAPQHLLAGLGLDGDANVQMAVESRFNQLGTCKHGDVVHPDAITSKALRFLKFLAHGEFTVQRQAHQMCT